MADDSVMREKLYDPRIAQPTSRYAVNVGGSSITVTPFRSVAATTSQISFNANVPSQTSFLDRAVELTSQVNYRFDVRIKTAAFNAPVLASGSGIGAVQPVSPNVEPVFVLGRDGALQALPLHGLISTLTCIINDTSVTVDLGTVMRELLRLTDYSANRKIRTSPTMLDRYANNNVGSNAVNNPLGGYANAVSDDEQPNGAWWDVVFCDPANGNVLTGTGTYVNPGANGGASANVAYVNGVPRRWYSDTEIAESAVFTTGYYGLGIRFRSSEFLMCSPLIFADAHEQSVSIFGLNNLQIVANLRADTSRTLRSSQATGRYIGLGGGAVAPYNFGNAPSLVGALPFAETQLNCTFISPSVNQSLPAVSMTPWQEFPRYVTSFADNLAVGESKELQQSSLTIPVVPDLMIYYARQATEYAPYQGDIYYPITKISLNFDNSAGLLSTAPTTALYRISNRNGLGMAYNEWIGKTYVANSTTTGSVATTGGFLVLKPGIDFSLSAGIASGVSGNFVVQANVTVQNNSSFASVGGVNLFLICINSGFFATLAGSSRIMRNLLTEADVVDSPVAPENDSAQLRRLVGGSFLSSLGNILTKGIDIAKKVAPVASAIKPLLPDSGMLGHVKSGMTAVGLGKTGGGVTGGGKTGGRAGLSARLM